MTKLFSILGSTGSIGITTLKILRKKKIFKINLLSADKNFNLICNQIKEFKPQIFVINNFNVFLKVKKKLKKCKTKIIYSKDFSYKSLKLSDVTLSAIPGMEGLEPTIEMVKKSRKLLIANKESVICGWDLIKNASKKFKTKLVPVDSEHFSIMQLLKNYKMKDIQRIYHNE